MKKRMKKWQWATGKKAKVRVKENKKLCSLQLLRFCNLNKLQFSRLFCFLFSTIWNCQIFFSHIPFSQSFLLSLRRIFHPEKGKTKNFCFSGVLKDEKILKKEKKGVSASELYVLNVEAIFSETLFLFFHPSDYVLPKALVS